MDLQIRGKRALVTGSSAGIGEGIAKALAREGATVTIHGRSEQEADRVAKEILAIGGSAVVVIGDLSNDETASQVAEGAIGQMGGVDILVNNAGIYAQRDWNSATPDQWLDIYNINVVSMVRLIKRLVPPMQERGWGRVINLSSVGATYPKSALPDYHATKAANLNMTVSLAAELAQTGITVNAISPGPIVTPRFQTLFQEVGHEQGWGTEWTDIERHLLKERVPNPAGRLGRVEDVGNAVAFLASPLAGFINGANIRVDGGYIPTVN